jgi:hypothetical protein
MSVVPLFLNGEGMRGGRVHPSIAHHRFLGETSTAPATASMSTRTASRRCGRLPTAGWPSPGS